jgi:hypothetical protein
MQAPFRFDCPPLAVMFRFARQPLIIIIIFRLPLLSHRAYLENIEGETPKPLLIRAARL